MACGNYAYRLCKTYVQNLGFLSCKSIVSMHICVQYPHEDDYVYMCIVTWQVIVGNSFYQVYI